MMRAIISKYMLFGYLTGRANPLEQQVVEDWVGDQENAETFSEWLLEYETTSPQFVPDQQVAIQLLLQRLESEKPPTPILSDKSKMAKE